MSLLSGVPGLSGIRVPHVPKPSLPLPGPVVRGVRAGARGALEVVWQLAGVPGRAVWSRPGRCYIAVHGVQTAGGERVARRVEEVLERQPGVEWARVNSPSGRVVVALGAGAPRQRELIALVAEAEAGAEARTDAECDKHGEWCQEPHHPCEGPRTRQSMTGLAADTIGLGIVTLVRLTPWAPLPAELASLAGLFEHHPRLRAWVARGLAGPAQAESLLPAVSALAQGVATRGGGLMLDAVQRIAQWREAGAYKNAWEAVEPQLVRGPQDAAAEPIVVERPVPAPKDSMDRYTDRSLIAGMAAGAAAVPFAGPRRGLAVALAGMPKAPEAGREGFATYLGRSLALRGVVAMDRGVLRRLGQVDCVVLDGTALRGDRYDLADLELLADADPDGTTARLFELFDADEPLETHRSADGWVLGPAADLPGRKDGEPDGAAEDAVRRLRKKGYDHLLGLARDGKPQAIAALAAQTAPGAQAVAAAARRAGARIVLAADRPDTECRYADAILPGGKRLVASVRELQANGAVVLLVSGNRRALGAADCGIGVHRKGKAPPWGAHLLVGGDLSTAGLIVDAVAVAAQVDRESAMLAAGGSGVGAVAAVQARAFRATRRAATAGHTAGSAAFCLGAGRARQLLARPPLPAAQSTPWHLMPASQVLERLAATPDGLSSREATARSSPARRTDGPRRTGLATAFVEELANPLTPVLAAGAALSAAVGSRTDAALVAAITGTSALVGGVQRVRTERALAELFERSAINARVRRDGDERQVSAGELVPGDVIVLGGTEDVVPADCRLLTAEGLEVDESSLTGESLPVAKDPAPVVAAQLADRRSMLYEGTTVAAGRATAVVVATGPATEVGRSLATARQAAPTAGVEKRLASLTKASLPIALGSAAAVAGAGLLHGRRLHHTLASAVNLAVASVPEGLPFLVSAAQLAAARRLAEHGALVRNPRTIEALGRADVLCFDKTGTLTEGTLELAEVSDGERALPARRLDDARRKILAAALRATPSEHSSEPLAHQTDRAVMSGAHRRHVTVEDGAPGWHRTDDLPFEPSRAYHATTGRSSRGALLSVKGAPENVLERCARRRTGSTADRPLDDRERARLTATAEELAGAGRRVLAVAERPMEPGESLAEEAVDGLVLLGFLTLSDPVRAGAPPAAERLREAGVQIVMLTGDHPATADAIASTINNGASQRVCGAAELDELDDDALDALLPRVDVIARCSPHHKVRIVQAYQRIGRVVAMTGDGANDAPAIRLADIGIALGRRGTPAATAAADLVVSDDRLETIIAALMEGRAMWTSVRAALAVLIGGNLGEIGFSVLAAALTGRAPLTARQIMLVNLLTDLAPALAIAIREPSGDGGERLLREGPDRSLGTALTRELLLRGFTTTLGATLAWGAARLTGRRRRAGTVALAAVVGTQLAQTVLIGGPDRRVLIAGLGSAAVLAAVIQTPGVSRFFGCTPMGPVAWGITLGAIAAATLAGTALAPVVRRMPAAQPKS
ncbi:haloacid dehalogenase [Streptomyces sp. WAC 06783]|uniref:cation-translocating P-type ATPase n=1 Tax=Streptomyces sp. WAC 06783 TaxID=2203211 RepID=UPI000F740782|nr:cation-translocating P-type ATPase [Streptomyces sp. WAC 06783]RSO03809.1 haloacid dehalogenase [Streptomyces sp. WAC 06783]